jgi:hypothetical protein
MLRPSWTTSRQLPITQWHARPLCPLFIHHMLLLVKLSPMDLKLSSVHHRLFPLIYDMVHRILLLVRLSPIGLKLPPVHYRLYHLINDMVHRILLLVRLSPIDLKLPPVHYRLFHLIYDMVHRILPLVRLSPIGLKLPPVPYRLYHLIHDMVRLAHRKLLLIGNRLLLICRVLPMQGLQPCTTRYPHPHRQDQPLLPEPIKKSSESPMTAPCGKHTLEQPKSI